MRAYRTKDENARLFELPPQDFLGLGTGACWVVCCCVEKELGAEYGKRSVTKKTKKLSEKKTVCYQKGGTIPKRKWRKSRGGGMRIFKKGIPNTKGMKLVNYHNASMVVIRQYRNRKKEKFERGRRGENRSLDDLNTYNFCTKK